VAVAELNLSIKRSHAASEKASCIKWDPEDKTSFPIDHNHKAWMVPEYVTQQDGLSLLYVNLKLFKRNDKLNDLFIQGFLSIL
jgi:hypothetical protein